MKKYWLMKTEPTCYSVDDLQREQRTAWSGVRNYQARNFMREMAVGDEVLVYHSNCAEPAVAGIGRVARAAYPDATQFDPKDDHFEPRATKEKPVWEHVDVAFVRKLRRPVTLAAMKFNAKLAGMLVRERGSRLSVQPVSERHFREVLAMEKE